MTSLSDSARVANGSIEELVIRGGLESKNLQKSVIDRMIDRFSSKVAIAHFRQDPAVAYEVYNLALELPMTATCQEFSKDYDIIVDGSVLGDNVTLQICFMNGKPSVLKNVTLNEFNRVQALLEAKIKHEHIVELAPISLHRKFFIVMPLLPITLASLSGIPERKAIELWDQIGSALDCLHSHGFAHKDVKPDNICIDSNGRFILIDMGDTVQLGTYSGSTSLFVPSDLDGSEPATEMIDWGMLALTVFDRMQDACCGVSFTQKKLSTTNLLDWFEEKHFTLLYSRMAGKFLVKG